MNPITAAPEAFEPVGHALHLLILGWGGLAVLVLALLVCIIGEALRFDFGHLVIGTILGISGGIMLIAWLIALFPYQSEYHRVYAVEGTVVSVSNVLDSASGELTSQPVARLDTVDVPLVVEDPRIVNMVGGDVTLTCRMAWHYQSADTFACEIRDFGVRP